MSKLFESAARKVAELDEVDQDTFASILFDEITAEELWAKSFEDFSDKLFRIADESLVEFNIGKTKPLDSDQL